VAHGAVLGQERLDRLLESGGLPGLLRADRRLNDRQADEQKEHQQ
jgi:hypothetical protein